MIQRLFSTFPDSWPGAGLLLLRLAAGAPLIVQGVFVAWTGAERLGLPLRLIEVACGILLLLGLWTPVAGLSQVVLQGWLAFTHGYADPVHIAGSIIGLSIAALGPGAYSFDARLFGRKRIQL